MKYSYPDNRWNISVELGNEDNINCLVQVNSYKALTRFIRKWKLPVKSEIVVSWVKDSYDNYTPKIIYKQYKYETYRKSNYK